jgi:hypothetical protein
MREGKNHVFRPPTLACISETTFLARSQGRQPNRQDSILIYVFNERKRVERVNESRE